MAKSLLKAEQKLVLKSLQCYQKSLTAPTKKSAERFMIWAKLYANDAKKISEMHAKNLALNHVVSSQKTINPNVY